MSFKSKMLAGAASLALVGGLAVTGGLSASAATPSCGPNFANTPPLPPGCINVFSRQFGTHRSPNFIMDVFRQGARVGQPIILFRTSNSDPAEDFVISLQGTVSEFFGAGLVSAATNLHYGAGTTAAPGPDDTAFELEYAPFGVLSGLCVGVFATAFQNEGVTLQPCGVTGKTVWIADTVDQRPSQLIRNYFPFINGSNTNFSHPFVLDYPANGFPTDHPRPQLKVTNLTGFSSGRGPIVGTLPNTQLWSATFGRIR
jgi:hypothetical protein